MKSNILFIVGVVGLLALGAAEASGPNYTFDRSISGTNAMPIGAGLYGTNVDNENNAGTHVADGDMGGTSARCIYNQRGSTNSPIEFNITLPASAAGQSGVLNMNVYDVDVNTSVGNPEVDEVYVNGLRVGTLTGADSIWGINYFTIPNQVLRAGLNKVQINVDTFNFKKAVPSSNWCVAVEWGTIKVGAVTATSNPTIIRAWVTPVIQTKGGYVNFFAEASGLFTKVSVYSGATKLVDLLDIDGDRTWSAQWQIPAAQVSGNFPIRMIGYKNLIPVSSWPNLVVQ